MKAILLACATAIVIAVICGVALTNMQTPADQGYVDPATVRLGA